MSHNLWDAGGPVLPNLVGMHAAALTPEARSPTGVVITNLVALRQTVWA